MGGVSCLLWKGLRLGKNGDRGWGQGKGEGEGGEVIGVGRGEQTSSCFSTHSNTVTTQQSPYFHGLISTSSPLPSIGTGNGLIAFRPAGVMAEFFDLAKRGLIRSRSRSSKSADSLLGSARRGGR